MYMYMYIAIGGWKLWSSASDIGRNPLSVWDILPDVTLSFMTLSSSYITLQISFKCPFSCWTVIYPTTISLPTHELISHSMSLSHALIQVAELPLKHVIWATYGFIALLLELNLSSFALMQSIDGNFLTQVVDQPMRRYVLMDLVLTNKEGLAGGVKAGDRPGCSDQKITEFRILHGGSRVTSRITRLDFRSSSS